MAINDYHPPISKLLTYGEYRLFPYKPWINYIQELDLTDEHIPELIQMATDRKLDVEIHSGTECWAPFHAWRALGLLGAEAAIIPLLNRLEEMDHDWVHEEIPKVISVIGPSAMPAVQNYIANPNHTLFGRLSAIDYFTALQERHPDQRERCIDGLAQLLANYKKNNPSLNEFLILELCDLKAVEKAPEIKTALDAHCVNLTFIGDWDDVQVELGLKTREEVSLKRSRLEALGVFSLEVLPSFKQSSQRPSSQGFGHTPSQGKKKKKKHR